MSLFYCCGLIGYCCVMLLVLLSLGFCCSLVVLVVLLLFGYGCFVVCFVAAVVVFFVVLLLCNRDTTSIRKQKFIGTRKHNSEAVVKTSHEHVTKDSDGSTKDVSMKNIQETPHCDDARRKRRGNKSDVVEPRSYWDMLMNGEEQ